MNIKNTYSCILILVVSFELFSQNKIEWSENYQLNFNDFKSGKGVEIDKNINSFQLIPGNMIYFNYSMSYAEFMFTKNFNSKVICFWNMNSAVIIAPDSITAYELLGFSQYFFNVSELYTRKFRKELYESKGVFSNSDFYKTAYEKTIALLSEKFSNDIKSTNHGKDSYELKYLNDKVNEELKMLADYCKTCKPKKKK